MRLLNFNPFFVKAFLVALVIITRISSVWLLFLFFQGGKKDGLKFPISAGENLIHSGLSYSRLFTWSQIKRIEGYTYIHWLLKCPGRNLKTRKQEVQGTPLYLFYFFLLDHPLNSRLFPAIQDRCSFT